MKKITLLVMTALVLFGCQSIPYADDVGFLNSAQSNSYEFPLKIRNTVCKDVNGNMGLCATRWANNQDLVLNIDPQPYVYTYVLTCSSALNFNRSQNIAANTATSITIPNANYGSLLEFTCIIQVFPNDRDHVSAQAEVRVVLYDPKYQAREEMYVAHVKGKDYLVLGQYALYSYVCDSGRCSQYHKETAIQVHDLLGLTAYSQSYQERFNYYGY